MALLLKLSFLFILVASFCTSISSSIAGNYDFRVAEPNFNKICESYPGQVFYRSQKIICIFCKGFDVSCFTTTRPLPSSSTAKPLPSSSVKSTFPVSSSFSVTSTQSTTEITQTPEPPEA